VSFGGSDPKHFTPVIDAKCLSWCPKLKYLGCIFKRGSCEIDVSPAVGKFYAQFNRQTDEMKRVQYILPKHSVCHLVVHSVVIH